MQATIAIRQAADAIQQLAGTNPNAKTAREALEAQAVEVRACTAKDAELPKAASKLDACREEELHGLKWNAKGGVQEALSGVALALYMLADDMEAEPAANRLDEIAKEVHAAQKTIAAAAIQIGGLLTEARAEFDAQAGFIAWAKEAVGYGKTMAFRLMKLHAEFKDTPEVAAMSLIALHTLTGISEEGKAKVVQLASDNKAAGKPAPTAKDVENAEPKAPAAPAEPSAGVDTDDDTGNQLNADSPAPWAADAKDLSSPAAPAAPAEPSQSEEVKRLYDIIEALRDDLAKAREASDKVSKSRSAAPMLPQFSNECYAARLGLSEAQAADPAKVKRALRDLVRAGYKSTHEAYPLLAEAAAALTDQSAAA